MVFLSYRLDFKKTVPVIFKPFAAVNSRLIVKFWLGVFCSNLVDYRFINLHVPSG